MNVRPAGVSDDESDDDEYFSFNEKDTEARYRNTRTKPLFKEAIKRDKNINNDEEDRQLQFNVITACTMGHLELVQEYLESHDVNDFFRSGWTPLLYAASSAQSEIIEYLLQNGADPNKHKDGYTPLMALCNSKACSLEKLSKSLRLLINAKADVDATNKQRETALMYACKSQKPEFVAELIQHVKNVNIRDGKERSALIYAAATDDPEIVKILLENGADVTLTDENDLTVMDIAEMKGYTKILSVLDPTKDEANFCEIYYTNDWRDMFPKLARKDDQKIHYEVSTMLYGMHLETYNSVFRGIDLKTFVQLTEGDPFYSEIDLIAHKKQFTEMLHKFHRKKWNVRCIGGIKKTEPFTMYDGVVCLGTIAQQVGIIGSSFRYIQKGLVNAERENVYLTDEQILEYEKELTKMEERLETFKRELLRVKALSKKINKENDIGVPATYISRKKNTTYWPIVLSTVIIIGVFLSKPTYVQRLWNT